VEKIKKFDLFNGDWGLGYFFYYNKKINKVIIGIGDWAQSPL
jgi:hypothetical protein